MAHLLENLPDRDIGCRLSAKAITVKIGHVSIDLDFATAWWLRSAVNSALLLHEAEQKYGPLPKSKSNAKAKAKAKRTRRTKP